MITNSKLMRIIIKLVTIDKRDYQFSGNFFAEKFSWPGARRRSALDLCAEARRWPPVVLRLEFKICHGNTYGILDHGVGKLP